MKGSSGRESVTLHGVTGKRSRPAAQAAGDEESRAPPAGGTRTDNVRRTWRRRKARPGGSDGVNPPGSSSLPRATGEALAGSNALRGHRSPTLTYRRRGENEQVGMHEWMGTMAETGSSVSRARTTGESQGLLGRTRASEWPPLKPLTWAAAKARSERACEGRRAS